MKSFIYKITTFLFLSGLLLTAWAQPTVDVCLRKTATKLEVVITPDAGFTGLVSNIQLTIRCTDPTVTYASPGDLQFYCSMAKGGDVTVSGGVVYQKFGGIGFLTLSSLGTSWTAGTDIVLFSVVPSSLTPVFEIVNDAWTALNNGAYYVELNAIDKTGSIGTCGTALPIEGLKLEADKSENDTVQLHWETEKEEVGSLFIIEKRGINNGFSTLDQVSGKGTLTYNYLDEGPMSQVNYYQIRQINPDGSELKSNVVEVYTEASSGIRLFPNPAKQETVLQFWEIDASEKKIDIINQLGQVLKSYKTTGEETKLTVSDLSEGIYHVKVSANGKVWEKILVKL
jgi:hypothetical protein